MTNSLKCVFSEHDIVNDIEQLYHKPDGFLVCIAHCERNRLEFVVVTFPFDPNRMDIYSDRSKMHDFMIAPYQVISASW